MQNSEETTTKQKPGNDKNVTQSDTADDKITFKLPDPERMKRVLGAVLESEELSINDLIRVVVPGGGSTQFEYTTPKGTERTETIQGVILHRTKQSAWFEDDNSDRPKCFSVDCVTGIGDPGGDCLSCSKSQWIDNQKPLCPKFSYWYFLLEGKYLPYIVKVPTTSLSFVKEYLLGIAGDGLSPEECVTDITLKKVENGKFPYSVLVLRSVSELPSGALDFIADYKKTVTGISDYTQKMIVDIATANNEDAPKVIEPPKEDKEEEVPF